LSDEKNHTEIWFWSLSEEKNHMVFSFCRPSKIKNHVVFSFFFRSDENNYKKFEFFFKKIQKKSKITPFQPHFWQKTYYDFAYVTTFFVVWPTFLRKSQLFKVFLTKSCGIRNFFQKVCKIWRKSDYIFVPDIWNE
jgi:hypothetical protein